MIPSLHRLLPPVIMIHATAALLRAAPGGTVPLETALDTTGIPWQTGGAAPWIGQTVVSHDGVDAAHSSGHGNGESWLAATVNGPGLLSFRMLVQTEPAEF